MEKKIHILFAVLLSLLVFSTGNVNAQMFWNNACSFAGTSSSFISRGNSTSLNISGSFTLEAWISPVNSTSPGNQILIQKREGANVTGYTLYLNNGKVTIRTDATTRLVGKTVLQSNSWSHIAGTYNSATGLFAVYVNGSLDTSATVAGAAPTASTDSLYIGKGFNSPYSGLMDEVRIWNRTLSTAEISRYRRTSLGTNSGVYNGLVMSVTFQDNDANGAAFILSDWSGNNNTVLNKGVTAADLSNRPYQTINLNDCIELSGNDDYLAGADNSAFSPGSEITLEAWIYPRSFDKTNMLIQKGLPDGKISDYNLSLTDGRLNAAINNISKFNSDNLIPLNRWTHVAFVFDGPNGVYSFYINGVLSDAGINDKGFIIDGTDSIYIGGTLESTDFDGFIDEVRIANLAKSQAEINDHMFSSIDESNDGPAVEAVYNFDGYTVSNVGSSNRLYFRNTAQFSHTGTVNNQPLSPLDRADALNFQEGYYMKTSDRRIPVSGNSGLMTDDSLLVYFNDTITDINVFVATNHNQEQDLEITLIAPNGETILLCNDNSLVANSDNLVTIFDDNADSSIVNGRYVSFAPKVRPINNMNSIFGGDNSSGTWIMRINDDAAATGDTGRLYGWGIQFNNSASRPAQLAANVLIQGFYNPATNLLVSDTMRFILRNTAFPYDAADTGKALLGADGSCNVWFDNIQYGVQYYIQLLHRNCVETWNSTEVSFDALTSQAQYDFTESANRAFGDNMIQIDDSPLEFAVYNGDADQDGSVNLNDVILIYNAANSFTSGYVITDMTGDDLVDLVDVLLAYNNSTDFVASVIPD